jgi:predicted permease
MLPREKAIWAKETLHLTPGGSGVSMMREDYKGALQLLLLAAVCVLLVACANTANLLLARGLKERAQTALHAALGASRTRLMSKALAESLALALLGAGAGVVVAYAGAKLILHLAFRAWVPVEAAPSAPVLLFALGISLITAVVFGMAPAWMSVRTDPMEALRGAKGHGQGARGILGAASAQKTLVIAQAAVSLVLISAAAMLGQSLRNMERQDLGFDTRGRYIVSIDPKLSNYKQEQLEPLFDQLEPRLRTMPGVRMVSSALYAPLSGLYWSHEVRMEGKAEPESLENASTAWTRVTPGFFETLGDTILMGRPLAAADNATARRVAVVNQAFAKSFFGNENPIGQHFGPAPRKNASTYEIVGVAADIRYFAGARDAVRPMYFVPEAQSTNFAEAHLESREAWSHYLYEILIWAPGNPPNLEAQTRKALASVDPNLLMEGVRAYPQIIGGSLGRENMIVSLTTLFGAVGLLLAAVGLYGVTAYGVERRTGEIGVRMALGAGRGAVVLMVLRGAFWQVGIGLALGIPAAIAAGNWMASRLFGIAPWDPLTLSAATLVLVVAALTAAAIPARRAASVDPVRALRAE